MPGSPTGLPEPLVIPTGGAVLCGVRHGAGRWPTAVFLHEGIADHRSWSEALDRLATDLDAIAYDRRGFGRTTYEAVAHDQVADLAAVLDATGVARTVLVGASRGGLIALDFTLTHPDRVDALVLVAPAISGHPGVGPDDVTAEEAALWTALEAADAAGDAAALNEGELRIWLDGPAGPAGRIGGDRRALAFDMNRIALAAKSPGHEPNQLDAWSRLDEISCPVLVMVGDLDMGHLQARCQVLVECIAGAELAVMPEAAHLVAFEEPARFAELVRDFLARRLDPSRSG